MNIEIIPIEAIEPNRGQIDGVPKNPRFIRDDNFKRMKESIEALPQMPSLREPIVMPVYKNGETVYVVIAGNQRFRALKDMGERHIVCKVLDADTDAERVKAYAMIDNGSFGRWDYDLLANEFDSDILEMYNVDVSAWQVKEQDFDGAGKELNLDDFDEDMKLKIQLLPEQMTWAKDKLKEINASPEIALLELTGWNESDQSENDIQIDPDSIVF